MVQLADSAAALVQEWAVTSPPPCGGREWEGSRTLHKEEAQQENVSGANDSVRRYQPLTVYSLSKKFNLILILVIMWLTQ